MAQPPAEQQEIFTVLADDQTISLDGFDQAGVREAQVHFSRACELDPQNAEANYFLNMVCVILISFYALLPFLVQLQEEEKGSVHDEDDDESASVAELLSDATSPPRKRLKG